LKPLVVKYALAAAAVALSVAGCSRSPIVTLKNNSGRELQNVVISGSGFSERVGTLSSEGSHSFSPHVRGESGIRTQFDAAGQHHDSGEQGYFEASGGNRVSVVIDSEMKVAVYAKLE
jgi:hypothetical protein